VRVLPRLVADAEIGEFAEVKVWRNEQIIRLSINLGLQPSVEELANIENNGSNVNIKALGLKVKAISTEDRARLKINNTLSGVIISEIDNDSFLLRQGISKDDIIMEIQGKQIQNPGDLLKIIDNVISQGKENVLLVFYAGQNAKKYIGAKLSVK
jgi:serine protease Do